MVVTSTAPSAHPEPLTAVEEEEVLHWLHDVSTLVAVKTTEAPTTGGSPYSAPARTRAASTSQARSCAPLPWCKVRRSCDMSHIPDFGNPGLRVVKTVTLIKTVSAVKK